MILIHADKTTIAGPVFHAAPELERGLDLLSSLPPAVWPGVFALAVLALFLVVEPVRRRRAD